MNLKVGQKSKYNKIYRCSQCGTLHAMIKGEVAPVCEICQEKKRKQSWVETNKEIIIISKNVKKEIAKNKSISDKISDKITDFCGSIYFVYIHIIWFGVWLLYNIFTPQPFDPYPFGLLTLIVSLEAIILATFILISQNRQSEVSELRSELDYQTDIKAEKNTAETLALLTKIYSMLKKNNNNNHNNNKNNKK